MADRLERVTNLLTLLLEARTPLTLRQIADELSAWYPDGQAALRGAFERDKAILREIGVPIETEVLGGDQAGETGYRIDRARYELRDLRLDDDERQALQVAVAAVRSDVGQEGVWKLGGAVLPSSAVVANVPESPALPVLRAASRDRRTATFTYRGVDRRLDPYGLLLREGFWYVIGHDHGHGEVRTYRVDRIEGDVEALDGTSFERPGDFDPRDAFPSDPKALGGGDDPDLALVWVDAPYAATVRREVGAAGIARECDDGGIEVRVPCANEDAFRSWLIGLGDHAEVLGPPDVRAGVVAWLRAIAGAS